MRDGKIVDLGAHTEVLERCEDFRQFNQCSTDEGDLEWNILKSQIVMD